MKLLSRGWQLFLDILFPQICLHCKAYLDQDSDRERMLCARCFSQIHLDNRCFYTNEGYVWIPLIKEGADVIRSVLRHIKYRRIHGALDLLSDLIRTRVELNPSLREQLNLHGTVVVSPTAEYLSPLKESIEKTIHLTGEGEIMITDRRSTNFEGSEASKTVFSLLGTR